MNMQSNGRCVKCFSVKSVLVGAVVAFGLMFLFNLLTVGGGLAAFTRTKDGLETLVTLAYAWTIVGSFVIFFIAGMVTSFCAHNCDLDERPRNEVLHGFVAWVLYILISLAFLSGASEATIANFPKSFITLSVATADVDTATSTAVSSATNRETPKNAQVVTPSEQKAVHKVGLATLAAFFIFFVEAIACCFGAWCGIECRYGPGCKSCK